MAGWLSGVLRFRLLVLGVAAGLLALGIVQLRSAPVDVLPEFSPPYAEVQTEALGLSAEEVEQLITVPLEADLLNGVEGIELLRSESVPGLSSIVMVFEEGTDVYRARQLIQERLTQAHALPNVSKPPTLLQPLSSSNRVMMIGLSSTEVSDIEQSVIARWTVKPRLMGVPGVANVSIWGMRDQQLQVQVDPERLRAQGVTLAQVISSAGNAQVVSPLTFLEASTPGTGGFVETPQQRLQVRHLIEKIANPAALKQVPVEGTGGRLRLGDVSTVTVDHQPLIGDAVVDEGSGLLLVVEKFPAADTEAVTEGVELALEELRPGLSGITDTTLFRPASYVADGLRNLGVAAGIGFALMLVVLAGIRRDWRSVVVVAVTVPVAVFTTLVVLRWLGQGINSIVLAGLAAAVAVVADQLIAFTDRLARHARDMGPGAPARSVLRETVGDVRAPLVYSALAVLLALTPAAVLAGRPGAFFRPGILAVALATAISVLVALTVAPALATLLLTRRGTVRRDFAMNRRLDGHYRRLLSRVGGRARTPLIAVAVLVVLGALSAPWLTSSLLPQYRDRTVVVQLQGEPGASAPTMVQTASGLGARLRALPGVAQVSAHVGRAITGDRVTDVHSADLWVHLEPGADHDDTLAAIEGTAAAEPDVEASVSTYTASILSGVGSLRDPDASATGDDLRVLTGAGETLRVRVYGEDPTTLGEQAERVRQVMSSVDGAGDVEIESQPTQPTIEIEVDLERAQRLGLTPGDVRRAEATLLQGIQVGSVFEDQKVFDVVVLGTPGVRDSVEDVSNLLIDRPGGGHVRLEQVADVRISELPAVVEREGVSRRVDVFAGVSGRSVDDVAADIERGLAELSFPLEYHAEVVVESAGQELGTGRVVGFAAGAAIAIFLLLQSASGSWRMAALIAACVPVALVGGLIGMLAAGAQVTFGALLGLLVLLGVFVHAALLLVSRIRWAQRTAGSADPVAVVQRAAGERLVPVLVVTVGLVALLAPVVVLGREPGLEVLYPMSLVVLLGLLTCAVVLLFVLPALLPLVTSPPRPDDGHVGEVADEDREGAGTFAGSTSTVYDSKAVGG